MRILLLVIALVLCVGCGKSVDKSDLLERNGLMYLPNSEDPFSGSAFSHHYNGQKESESEWKDGKLNGKFSR